MTEVKNSNTNNYLTDSTFLAILRGQYYPEIPTVCLYYSNLLDKTSKRECIKY